MRRVLALLGVAVAALVALALVMSWVFAPVVRDVPAGRVESPASQTLPEAAAAGRPAWTAEGVSVPPPCQGGSLVDSASAGLGRRATWWVDQPCRQVCAGVLQGYRDAGVFDLVTSGDLALASEVWGCVVTHVDGWAELVVVDGRRADGQGVGCLVTVVRLGQDAIAGAAE